MQSDGRLEPERPGIILREEEEMTTSETPHPTRTEFVDFVDLSDGQIWILCFEEPVCSENIPRLFLEQYPDQNAFEKLESEGRVWLRPEDLPKVTKMLATWSDLYRKCAHDDLSGPLPRPNWGNLSAPVEGGD
jgi:hypothetical protein